MYGRKRGDKIFDNKYNTGSLGKVSDEEIKIDSYYQKKYLDSEYNMENNYKLVDLTDKVYDLIEKNDRFSFILKEKKVIKKIVPDMLVYILTELEEYDEFRFSEKFFVICNVLDIKETIVYDSLPIQYRDIAIQETMEYVDVVKRSQKESMDIFVENENIDDPDDSSRVPNGNKKIL